MGRTARDVALPGAVAASPVATAQPKAGISESKPSWSPPLSKAEMNGLIEKAATDNNLDQNLIRAMMHQEDPTGDPRAVSPKGAMGHMQLMPDTARELGVKDPFNPRENITAGARHMRAMLDKYKGNVALALAAYNARARRVDSYGGIPNIKKTQDYVKRIMARYGGQQ